MNVKNSLNKTQGKAPTFSNFITSESVKRKINNMVGGKDGQRFITAIISAVSTNEELAKCDQGTILSAAMLGESLKLSPSPQLGQYYMVPYNQKEKRSKDGEITQQAKKVAQFQLGYKGYIQLAEKSGQYKRINVVSIKEGELTRFNPLDEEIEVRLIEDEDEREETPTMGYYAMFEYLNGFRKAIYWSKSKMLRHADKYSAAFSKDAVSTGRFQRVSFEDFEQGNYPQKDAWKYSSFWYKDFDGMAHKTMLRQLISKWGIMSIDMQTAVEKDMMVLSEDGSATYVDGVDYEMNAVEVSEVAVSEPALEAEMVEVEAQEDDFFNTEVD